jgi:hypothetical protein
MQFPGQAVPLVFREYLRYGWLTAADGLGRDG